MTNNAGRRSSVSKVSLQNIKSVPFTPKKPTTLSAYQRWIPDKDGIMMVISVSSIRYAAYLLCSKEMLSFSLNTMDINKRYSSGIWIQKWRFFQPKWFWFFVSVPTERSCAKINTKIPIQIYLYIIQVNFLGNAYLLSKLNCVSCEIAIKSSLGRSALIFAKFPEWQINPIFYFEIDSKIQLRSKF